MIAGWVLALLLTSPAAPRPTSGAMRRAFDAAQAALVEVQSRRGRGFGVLVGSDGEVLTSVGFVELEQATVRFAGGAFPAKVRFAEAELGVALLMLDRPGPYRAMAVHAGATPKDGWIVAVERGREGRAVPHLGRIQRRPRRVPDQFFLTDVAVGAGSPVLDLRGQLLGLVVARTPEGSRALGVPALRARLSAPGTPTP